MTKPVVSEEKKSKKRIIGDKKRTQTASLWKKKKLEGHADSIAKKGKK